MNKKLSYIFIAIFLIMGTFICVFLTNLIYGVGLNIYLNHQEYGTCKLIEDACSEDFSCNYFGEKEYNIYCDALTGYDWQYKYVPYNLTKNIFAHVCKEEGDIVYFSNSTDKEVKTMTCVSGEEYNIGIVNTRNITIEIGVLTDNYIPYFKDTETNETYLVSNGLFNITISPYGYVSLSYNPRDTIWLNEEVLEEIINNKDCK